MAVSGSLSAQHRLKPALPPLELRSSCTLPAANTPSALVAVLLPAWLMSTYPVAVSFSAEPCSNCVFGAWPIATKAAATSSFHVRPPPPSSLVLRSHTERSAPPAPSKRSTTVRKTTVIFGCESTREARAWLARSRSRRWTSVTADEVRARTSASSAAVSPPPTTWAGGRERGRGEHECERLSRHATAACGHLRAARPARSRGGYHKVGARVGVQVRIRTSTACSR